jgi:hypothetical protein
VQRNNKRNGTIVCVTFNRKLLNNLSFPDLKCFVDSEPEPLFSRFIVLDPAPELYHNAALAAAQNARLKSFMSKAVLRIRIWSDPDLFGWIWIRILALINDPMNFFDVCKSHKYFMYLHCLTF